MFFTLDQANSPKWGSFMTSGANNKNLIMHLNNVQGMVRGVQGAHDPLLSGGLFLSTSDFSVVGNVANSYPTPPLLE